MFLMKLISTPAMYFSPVKGACGEKVRWEVVCRTLLDKASCSLTLAGTRRGGVTFPIPEGRSGGCNFHLFVSFLLLQLL